MKITKSTLKRIIKEEIEQLARGHISLSRGQAQNVRQTQDSAKKIIKLLSSTDPDNVDHGLAILDFLEDQQLTGTIASYITFDSKSNLITTRGFDRPQELGMILNYFAEKSDRVKNMLNQIEILDMTDGFITNVDFLIFCTNLKSLNLLYCTSLENIDGLKGCTNLITLDLRRCESLQNVDGLKGCTNLTRLNLGSCKSLQNVDELVGCTNLKSLNLSFCESLQNVDGLEGCTNLTTLNLRWCSSLPPELQELFITDEYGTAHEKFMEALNAAKGNSL